jgi:hypothetical protein
MGILAGIELTNILYEEKLILIIFKMNKFNELSIKKFKTRNLTKN